MFVVLSDHWCQLEPLLVEAFDCFTHLLCSAVDFQFTRLYECLVRIRCSHGNLDYVPDIVASSDPDVRGVELVDLLSNTEPLDLRLPVGV